MPEKKIFYVSLVRGLTGYYVLFEAEDEMTVRNHVAAYFGRMWCGVYTKHYFYNNIAGKYPARIVNEDKPIILHDWQWE
jgi:hypothetical protein